MSLESLVFMCSKLRVAANKIDSFYYAILFTSAVFLTIVIYGSSSVYAANFAVVGRAVAENTGGYLDFSQYNSNVRVNWLTGEFEGYAFSEDVGWVAFGTQDNPQGPVMVNTTTGAVTGKAKVIITGAYIDFTDYESNVVINVGTGVMTGYAFSEDVGWFNFNDPGVEIADFTNDLIEPSTNASNITMSSAVGGYAVSDEGWTNGTTPVFSWTAGADNEGGSGLRGYCLYLGTAAEADPGNSVSQTGTSGLLTNSPASTVGTDCMFIVESAGLNLAAGSYLQSSFVNGETYYLRIKAIDNAGNTYNAGVESFSFSFDNAPPTNTLYISCAAGSFSSVTDMAFSWPTASPGAGSSDDGSGVLGWQYQINSMAGEWLGTSTSMGINYIPVGTSSRTLTQEQDGEFIVMGNNVVYFRTVDAVGNVSPAGTERACTIALGGGAPTFGGTDVVTVTPSSAEENLYALSWPGATASDGRTIGSYYYMANTSPPASLETLTGNPSTYISVGTSTTVSARALPNVNKGTNSVSVVAVDDANNYSPSNFITGTFTLNSADPDNAGNLLASDSSIKSQEQWNVTLTWTEASYKGAGNLTYLIYRSSNGTSFTEVGSTAGLSYVDNVPLSAKYYYKVYTKDSAEARSSGTNAVSITPTGRWTVAPDLDSGPVASGITTKRAVISWSTNRASDSKVAFGVRSGTYYDEEPSNSSQVASHVINLTNLTPGTKYYYIVKWTDEDGNTGTSQEKTFTTSPAPIVKNVDVRSVDLSSAIIDFTTKGASKAKISYGQTTDFGAVREISTAVSESNYTTLLTGLEDGTKYYYRINTFDSENAEYEGTILDFTTLPRPRVSQVLLEQVANTAQTTIRVSWTTNTEVSSIVSYWPVSAPTQARDEVQVALEVGERSMVVQGLLANTGYELVVKGRDKLGNEAVSDTHRFTTATDTRPPAIYNLKVIGGTIPPVGFAAGEVKAQLIVTWDTDEPATGQVEFGEGTGASYPNKSQEDGNLTTNHTAIISNLTPSQVYHLRVISKDAAGNEAKSVDVVTIAPKATRSALDLVMRNLEEAFSFLGFFKAK
jgi:hypothetical protein